MDGSPIEPDEPDEVDDDSRNHQIENRILEAANAQLATANTNSLSNAEVAQLESITDRHHANRLSRLLTEKQREETLTKWASQFATAGTKVVIRLFGVPI